MAKHQRGISTLWIRPGGQRRRELSLPPLGAPGLAAAVLAGIATLAYLQPPSAWLRRGVVHVAPDGFDGFLGPSRRLAVRTIQRAAQLAEPGETILLWPGVYREDVVLRRGGRPGRPLVLRSAVPGRAVISGGADPSVMNAWRWRSLGDHLWSTPVRWRVDGLRWKGVRAFRSRSLPQLRHLCAKPGAWPAFASTARQLWLCLPRGERPAAAQLEVRRPMPTRTRSGGHQVASLWLEAPYVEVRDLRFDFVVMAAIQLWNTHHVTIEGNQFADADVAINDRPSVHPARAIAVRHNLSSCYPLYEWGRRGWLNWYELYAYSNCSLTWLNGSDLEVSRNVVLQAGDAIKISPEGGTNVAHHNWISETTDDGFEFDGAARNLRIANNLVINSFVALAASPVFDGPLLIEDNTVLIFPFDPQVGYGVLLKLMGGPIRNVTLQRNVYVGYRMGHGSLDSPVHALRIEANGLATLTGRGEGLAQAPQIEWRDNRYLRLSMPSWTAARQGPVGLEAVGAHPVSLGPIGPSWLDLARDPAAKPLAPYRRSSWLAQPRGRSIGW
jgi:hypothetical protein